MHYGAVEAKQFIAVIFWKPSSARCVVYIRTILRVGVSATFANLTSEDTYGANDLQFVILFIFGIFCCTNLRCTTACS